ncbi:MAG TPA: hypothetical protein VGK77_01390 [Candidatus Binatia bacterium]|jgi:ABC-type nitrate/sulfonate/bicarbonate transport system substrate-binding protein
MVSRCPFTLLLSLVILLCALLVSAQTTVRVAVAGAQAASIPFNVGTKKGIFPKHGLNVEMMSIVNGQTAARAQLSGSVQLATSNAVGFFYLTNPPLPLRS